MNDISVGVDIESISRFENLDRDVNGHFLNSIFTEKEMEYCYSKKEPARHLAARFAGKEAVVKAISGMSLRSPRVNKIEILKNKKGVPSICIIDDDWSNDYEFKISLSHCDDKALAFAVIHINKR